MSWGLHYYEQQDKNNRAQFPEIFSAENGRPSFVEGEDDEAQDMSKDAGWKYEIPENLREPGDLEEDYYYEEDDPLQQQNSDVFHE